MTMSRGGGGCCNLVSPCGGCCGHVPGRGEGAGVVTMSQGGGRAGVVTWSHPWGEGAGVVTMSQVGVGGCNLVLSWGWGGGRCCDHVPGGQAGVVTWSHPVAGVVNMSQGGGGRVL